MQKIKYTAFLDILGFSNYIKKEITNNEKGDDFYNCINKDLIECLKHLKNDNYEEQFKGISHLKNISLDYLWISDTFVLSIENENKSTSKEKENKLKAMMIFILSLCVSYINFYFIKEYNLCIRGGITSKFTYLKDRLLLGEGISEAHSLESNIAIFPRIIFSNDIITKEVEYYLSINSSPIIKKDCDDYYFIDYLNILNHTPPMCGKSISSFKIITTTVDEIANKLIKLTIEEHKNLILIGLKNTNEKINQKYSYLKEYHNKFINSNDFKEYLIK